MTEDMYLSLAAELYEKGTWDENNFIKRVTLYASERNIAKETIEEFIKRVTKKEEKEEYSISDKRDFLSVLTLDGKEPKYGESVVNLMDDAIVEKFYAMEVDTLSNDKVEELHNLAKNKELKVEEPKENIVPVFDFNGNNPEFDYNPELINAVPVIDFNKPVENSLVSSDILEEKKEIESLGETKEEGVLVFDFSKNNKEPEYDTNLTNSVPVFDLQEIEEKSSEESQINEEDVVVPEEEPEQNEEVVPEINFDELSEEDYNNCANNVLNTEKDSDVKFVEATKERIAKLRKGKGKAINIFLKAVVVVASLALYGVASIGVVAGYAYFANKIKNGEFNPTNIVGKAIKNGIEKVMYMGMNKEEIENERGKTR